MSKLRYAIVIGAILALAATALAQSPATQPGMSAQQAQPTMPGQQPPATPGQPPAAPGQQPSAQPQTSQSTPSTGASPADDAARQLAQVVNLSEAQTSQVRDIFQGEHSQLTALQSDRTMSSQEKQTKLTDIRRTASNKVMAVLTPEQQQKLKDAVQKHQQQNQPSTPQPAQKPPQ